MKHNVQPHLEAASGAIRVINFSTASIVFVVKIWLSVMGTMLG